MGPANKETITLTLMVKSWSLPIAGTCDAEASVPRTDWEVIPLQLDSLITYSESQPYPRHIQGRNIGLFCFDADNRTLSLMGGGLPDLK